MMGVNREQNELFSYHVDGSLIEADASVQSVLQGPLELIKELKAAYAAQPLRWRLC